ncbi:TPA: hypothetical protein ACRTM4_003514 [Aeromonas hydrophila]|uniref:hypothetical protein n=1 Tax=Aeromonas TaxID=642 RepID=UPI00090958A5|nr:MULTISPECIES: hypothetical protein [Aeromonas]APJ17143.1 hypothetical protein BOQ57_20720 [Aeromonas hydrophila]BBT04803.1 hypothetical protein WP7S18E06_03020 [Aeromonas hydrophila]HEB5078978.1 hypothetical protein [Aeromonas hydrophila subsp. hydrophila]
MSYALIDNASLTAVDRVLGKIVINNSDAINGDLVAFENMIQAILFYDDLICIDNYKKEYKAERAIDFNFIRFLSPTDTGLADIEKMAQAEARLIQPKLKGGGFADDDFRELIDLLKLNMICTWDIRSSVYYLTIKMLGEPYTEEYTKYSELSAAIFSELSDASTTKGFWSTKTEVISRESGNITKQLEMFIASLNWLAFKSIYYSMAAKHLRADTFIHPIRHAYQLHWMRKTGAFGHDFSAKLISSLSDRISTTVSEVIDYGRSTTVSLDIPIFSVWLAREAGGIEHVINAALELKKSDHFMVARNVMREIKISYDEGGISNGHHKVAKLSKELDMISGDLKRKYGVPSSQGIQGSFLIKVFNSVSGLAGGPILPEKNFVISMPSFLQGSTTKAFSIIFKNIANELTSMERLGGHRDLLSAGFKIDEKNYSRPKTEDPRFRWRGSWWKQPM